MEVLNIQCPQCSEVVPAQANFCPACQYPLRFPPEQATGKSIQEITAIAATTHQGNASPTRVQQTLPRVQEADAGQQQLQSEEKSTNEAGEEDKLDGEDGPGATLRKRLISFNTLSRPLQVLLVVTLVQIGIVALLLLTQNLPQPRVSSGILTEGGIQYVVPLVAFFVLEVSFVVGCWFALTGALRVHWSVRFLVIALVTGLLAVNPIISLMNYTGARVEPYATEAWLRRAQLLVLALFWIWGLGVSLSRWYMRKSHESQATTRPWHEQTFRGVLALLLIYYGLEFGVWLAYVQAGLAATGTSFLIDSIGYQAVFLPPFLVLIILWGTTDLLEWGEIISKQIVFSRHGVRSPRLLVVLTSLVAIGLIVNVLRQASIGLIWGLVAVVVIAGIVALLVRFAQVDADWPKEIPTLVLLLGAIFIFIDIVLLFNVTYSIATWQGLAQQVVGPISSLLKVPFGLITLTIGLLLVVFGRMGKQKHGAVGLFLVMLVLLVFIGDLPSALAAAGLPVQQPDFLLGAVMLCAAVGTLVWVIRLLARRKPLAEVARPLAYTFLLLVGLQIIDWVHDLLRGIGTLGSLSTLLLAGFFLLTTLWGFITSGDQVTNVDSSSFPRDGRILLYVGYTLVTNALLLYLGTLRTPITGAVPPDYLTSDLTGTGGFVILGLPLVVLGFILKMGQHEPGAGAVSALQATKGISPRAMQFGIVGSGALVTALLVVFGMINIVPQILRTNASLLNQPYRANIPGPGCDTGGANWSVTTGGPISTRCLPAGLQVTGNPQEDGRVIFSLTAFPRDYRVSVHVAFSGFDECAAIGTRFTARGEYQSAICADGSWLIARAGEQPGSLAVGVVARANAYTIEATSDGPNQRFAINGIEVATVSDTVVTGGTAALELNNTSKVKKSAIFSNFVFIPLPAPSPISPQTTYQASIPGINCDKGGAQWALMTPTKTAVRCQANGMQVETKARSQTLIAFTPPSDLFPQNYRVSLRINLGSLSSGCVAIATCASGESYYRYDLCTGGLWEIVLQRSNNSSILAIGQIAIARTYTIEATAEGPNQRLAINGVEVGSTSDTTFSTTSFINLVTLNASTRAGSVVFSSFVFTPLPALPLISAQTSYQASIPGAACDTGGAQWALMTPTTTSLQCQPAGMQVAAKAQSQALIAFTPPSDIFPQNYRVSVKVDFSNIANGCAGFEVRASGEGNYTLAICKNGLWLIILQNGGNPIALASHSVAPATVYTIEVTAEGSNLRLVINGTQVGSASNSMFTTTRFIALGFTNNSRNTEAVVFSNFVFTPLP